jgi:hypothetical protein
MVPLALTRCAVQEVELAEPAGPSFEVYALPGDTRTVNDGLATQWLTGDKFNLYHADAGSKTYTTDGAFTVDDPETGHAVGSVAALTGASHDWYLAYPYASSASSPASVPVTIGAAAGTAQVQAGAESMAHLAGPAVPLRGKASAVAADATPSITVSPAVSVLAVNVMNPGEADVTVTEIRFKAPEAIVGTFTMDITGETPTFKAVNASDEAILSISGGAVLNGGGNGIFYLVVKPFSAGAGTQLTLSVNGQARTVSLTAATRFSPGRMKTLNFTLEEDQSGGTGPYFFKRVNTFSAGNQYILVADENPEGTPVLRMAHALPAGSKSGRLAAEDVTEEDGLIILNSLENAFSFYAGESGTLIRQADGRYLYNNNSSDDVYAGTTPAAGYYWTITFEGTGLANIVNRQRQLKYNAAERVRAFQTRKTGDSGLLIRLYELQNSDAAREAFLKESTPGVYAYEGSDWLYADGSTQTSIRTGGGTIAFRIFEPSAYSVLQLTGLPVAFAENDRFNVRFTRYVKQAATHVSDLSVQVLRIADGKAWLMAGNGSGFIICLQ